MHNLRELKYAGCGYTAKTHHTKKSRDNISRKHSDQDRSQLHDPFSEMVQYSYNDKRKDSHSPVLPGAVSLTAGAACHIVDGCGIQGETNGKHNGSRDQRRKEYPDLPYQQSHHYCHASAYDLRAEYGCNTVSLGNGLHTRHIGKADAHDDGQGGADVESAFAAQGKELEQCGDCGHKKSSLNEDDLVSLRHTSPADSS